MAPWRVWLAFLLVVGACGGRTDTDVEVDGVGAISVTSRAFRDGDQLPVQFTCDGEGSSPPLAWSGPGTGVRAWALVVDDPDAPSGTFVHWLVLDIPPETLAVDAGAVPGGGMQARNSSGRVGYAPACPPSGTHRYRFSVYALSEKSGLPDGVDLGRALEGLRSLAEDRGTLATTYARPGRS